MRLGCSIQSHFIVIAYQIKSDKNTESFLLFSHFAVNKVADFLREKGYNCHPSPAIAQIHGGASFFDLAIDDKYKAGLEILMWN